MIRGLYSAAAGLLSSELREGVIANNLANSSTAGFKARDPEVATYGAMQLMALQPNPLAAGGATVIPLGTLPGGSLVDTTSVNWGSGSAQSSPNPLSATINGAGFFGVQTPGGVEYTRAGDFHLDANGTLVAAAGDTVLSPSRTPIRVFATSNSDVALTTTGAVVANGSVVGQVGVFRPANNTLEPQGQDMFALVAGAAAPAAAVPLQPGFIEQSNVDLIGQMAALLEIQQAYGSDQQAITAADQTMSIALSDVGTVS